MNDLPFDRIEIQTPAYVSHHLVDAWGLNLESPISIRFTSMEHGVVRRFDVPIGLFYEMLNILMLHAENEVRREQ